MLEINRDRCLNCAGCICLCPETALTMDLAGLQVDQQACTLCALCVRFCPVLALEITAQRISPLNAAHG
jgi:ferredoxin